MKTSTNPVGSALLVWLARTAAPLVRTGVVVLVARWLGAAGLGAYQIILANVLVFETIASLGLWSLLVRSVVRAPALGYRYLVHGTVLTLAVSALLMPIMYLSSAGYDPETRWGTAVLALTLAPGVVIIVAEAVLVARGAPQMVAWLRVIENAALVGLTAAALMLGHGLVAVTVAMLITRVGCALAAFVVAQRACSPRVLQIETAYFRELLAAVPVFLGMAIVWALWTRVDVLVLSRLASIEAVGWYSAGLRISAMAQEVPASVMAVVLPMLAAAHAESPARFTALTRQTSYYFLVFSLPVAVGATLIGGPLLVGLFGPGFEAAVPPFIISMWTLVPACWMKLLGQALIASDRQRADLSINTVVLVVTTGLLVALVPGGGAMGAAWAMFWACNLALGLRLAVLWQGGVRVGFEPRVLAIAGAAAAMGAAVWTVQAQPVWLAISVGVVAYAAALVGFGGISREELATVRGRGG
jgi:O-antigen/teichoic acid export membrane protein